MGGFQTVIRHRDIRQIGADHGAGLLGCLDQAQIRIGLVCRHDAVAVVIRVRLTPDNAGMTGMRGRQGPATE